MTDLTRELQALEQKVTVDSLTGLANRAHLDQLLALYFERTVKNGGSLSVLFCDVDQFKGINDTYGHQTGDRVLAEVARRLKQGLREADRIGRFGGDEFVILLPGCDAPTAQAIIGRLRALVETRACQENPSGRALSVSLSIGSATQVGTRPFRSAVALLQAADAALYAVKRRSANALEQELPVVAHALPAPPKAGGGYRSGSAPP
jgi:diguanylate cyclase (GGDEF)-like protein